MELSTNAVQERPQAAVRRSPGGWKKAARFLVFWAVFLLLLAGVCKLMSKRHSSTMGVEVLRFGDEIQVAFAGSSHTMNDLCMQQLWEEQGIRTQAVASPGETMVCTYWHLRNALDYMQPEMVLVDLYGIVFEGKIYPNGDPRAWLDSLPFSRTKVETVLDLYGVGGLDALWPFTYEHTRWSELEEEDALVTTTDLLRGVERVCTMTPQAPYTSVPGEGETNALGLGYLRKIIDLCAEKEIPLVALVLPYTTTTPRIELNVAAAVELSQRAGIEVLDLRTAGIVDPKVDFIDYHHLNASGADKLTRWLGEWLKEQGIRDQRGVDEALTQKWDESYAAYRQLKREEIQACTELDELLLRLHDTDYSCILSIPPDLYLWNDDSYAYMRDLLENLGIELTGNENETGLYAVVDSRNAAFTVQYGLEPVQTDWGLVQWQDRTDGTDTAEPMFRVGEDDYFFYGEVEPDRAANILIVENVTGNLIYQHIYRMSGDL